MNPVAVLLLAATAVLASVAWCGAAILAVRSTRGRRAEGLLRLAAELAVREVAVVVTMAALTPFRRWVHDWHGTHYRLVQWWLDGADDVARRRLGLRVDTSQAAWPDTAFIALCRHAGLGDSLLLIHTLLAAGRRPRVVMQGALRWDPVVDIAGGRLPVVFVPVQPARRRAALPDIARLTRELRPDDAIVIFPEGGNYTPARHRRAIDHLMRAGRTRHARQAARLRHLLPPRAAGTRTLLSSATTPPLVLVAHAGLDHLTGIRALWQSLPLRRPVVFRAWRVAREDVPRDARTQTDWLFDRWVELDRWVSGLPDHVQSRAKEMSA